MSDDLRIKNMIKTDGWKNLFTRLGVEYATIPGEYIYLDRDSSGDITF